MMTHCAFCKLPLANTTVGVRGSHHYSYRRVHRFEVFAAMDLVPSERRIESYHRVYAALQKSVVGLCMYCFVRVTSSVDAAEALDATTL